MDTYPLPTRQEPRCDTIPTEIPAGTYWVGDPCYADSNREHWDAYGASNDWFQSSPIGTDGDAWCVGIGTKYGDGVYRDQDGREYPVDAGMIGVTPAYQWTEEEPPFGSHLVTFERPVRLVYSEGVIYIGTICIDTDEDDNY